MEFLTLRFNVCGKRFEINNVDGEIMAVLLFAYRYHFFSETFFFIYIEFIIHTFSNVDVRLKVCFSNSVLYLFY